MEITSLFIGIVIGAISGSIVLYLILKSRNIPREIFDELNGNFIRSNADLQNSKLKISELDDLYQKEKEINFMLVPVLIAIWQNSKKKLTTNTVHNWETAFDM